MTSGSFRLKKYGDDACARALERTEPRQSRRPVEIEQERPTVEIGNAKADVMVEIARQQELTLILPEFSAVALESLGWRAFACPGTVAGGFREQRFGQVPPDQSPGGIELMEVPEVGFVHCGGNTERDRGRRALRIRKPAERCRFGTQEGGDRLERAGRNVAAEAGPNDPPAELRSPVQLLRRVRHDRFPHSPMRSSRTNDASLE